MNTKIVKIFISVVAIMLFFTFRAISQKQKYHDYINELAKSKQIYYKDFFKPAKTTVGNEYNLVYNQMHWYVNPVVREINGVVTSWFHIINNGTTDITFDFSDTLTVDSVIYHNNIISYTLLQDILTINLPVTLNANDFDSVSIFYHGVPRYDGNRTFGQALQDSVNYQVPIIWTLSEPYGAKEWWPCKQNLNDKIDSMDVFITVPDSFIAASNGFLVDTITSGGNTTFHWKHTYPIAAYLVAFAVTDYREIDWYAHLNSGDSLLIQNFSFPGDSADWASHQQVIDYIQFFDTLVGTYPFYREKYGHAQFSWQGGMEHQTIGFMVSLHPELVSHELAHQWFGDAITCGSWTDIWLNEGFATYFSGLTFEFMDTMWWDDWRIVRLTDITSQPDGSVFCDDTTNIERIFSGRLSYGKGAYLLHMVRWEIGDSAFFQAIKNYFNDIGLKYNYATTNDLKLHFEDAADTNLTEFFNDWFYGQGFPMYSVYWSQSADSMATISVNQTQTDVSVSFFEMHLPLKLVGSSEDTIVVLHHLYNGQVFTFKAPCPVSNIVFDPDMHIVTKDPQIQHVPIIGNKQNILVFPNPAGDEFHIVKPANLKLESVSIIDMDGRKIMQKSYTGVEKDLIVSLYDLDPGTYMVRIKTEFGIINKKLIKNQ